MSRKEIPLKVKWIGILIAVVIVVGLSVIVITLDECNEGSVPTARRQ